MNHHALNGTVITQIMPDGAALVIALLGYAGG